MDYDTIRDRYYYKNGTLYNTRTHASRAVKDAPAGAFSHTRGYGIIKYNNRNYLMHRVVYCYFNECHYDDISPWEIDHLNNDRQDNRIENLCLCEHWENQHNRIDSKRNGGMYNQNERRRLRYKNDPEFRALLCERSKAYYIRKTKSTKDD